MRRLILMRHAKAVPSEPARRDIERPLNERGRRDAALMGAWLKRAEYLPERALVSSATRARETWDAVAGVIGAVPADFPRKLYHAAPAVMLAALRAAGSAPAALMLGHQPGIGEFARQLLREPPDDPAFAKYATAATAVIDFDISAWPDAAWSTGRLTAFATPRSLG